MSNKEVIKPTAVGEAERIPGEGEYVEVGEWYWVKGKWGSEEVTENLMCVADVGFNMAVFECPRGWDTRVHFDKWDELCRRETDAQKYIAERVGECRERTAALMQEVQDITASLGVGPRAELEGGQSTALTTLSGRKNVDEYKQALIKAQKEKLPELFEKIKKSNEAMARWMQAEMLPMKAKAGLLKGVISKVKERIFHVELYAGVTEEVVQVREGEPAGLTDKLRVM